jgi:hypothetical protein
MNSPTYLGNLLGTMPKPQLRTSPRSAAWHEDWTMLRRVGWVATTAFILFLIWQAAAAEPLWSHAASAIALLFVSLLTGLRIGADSAAAYTKDLYRLNKTLSDANQELQESNLMLLKQLNSESPTREAC